MCPPVIQLQDEFSALTLRRADSLRRTLSARQRDLLDLWDRCLVGDELRCAALMAGSAELKAVEQEARRVRKYYEENRDVLDRVYRHEQLFKELVELEVWTLELFKELAELEV